MIEEIQKKAAWLAGIVGSAIIGAALFALGQWFNSRRSQKKLVVRVRSVNRVAYIVKTKVGDIVAIYNDEELHPLWEVCLRIENRGFREIRQEDYDGDLRITTPERFPPAKGSPMRPSLITAPDVTRVFPKSLTAAFDIGPDGIHMSPIHLNPGDSIDISFTTSYSLSTMKVECRIKGMRGAVDSVLRNKREVLWSWLSLAIIPILVAQTFLIQKAPPSAWYLVIGTSCMCLAIIAYVLYEGLNYFTNTTAGRNR